MKTPEEIVAIIGNIANRMDIAEAQKNQKDEIYKYVRALEIAKDSFRSLCNLCVHDEEDCCELCDCSTKMGIKAEQALAAIEEALSK
jgi:hypothetical protein